MNTASPTATAPISARPFNTVLHGDCLKVLPTLPAGCADFILTDPPYLVNYRSRDGRRVANDDNDAWLKPAFAAAYRVLARDRYCVSFYSWSSADRFITAFREAGFRIVGHLVFAKRYASASRHLRYHHECAFLLAKGEPAISENPLGDVIPWRYEGNHHHPTQKPLSVLAPLIKAFSAPGEVVLDPFAGSGSTLVAAAALGRSYLGIELYASHCATARGRLT